MGLLLKALDCPDHEVSLLFTDDRHIRDLNRDYRKLDKATDVLSFSQREGEFPDPDPSLLGDIVISTETVHRRVQRNGKPATEELFSLLIHGLLHLLGYDHEKSKGEAKIMRTKEKELFQLVRDL